MSGIRIDPRRLRQLREARVLDRRSLAHKSGVGLSTIADVESGYCNSVRPATIRALAGVLRVRPEKLLV